MLFVMLFRELSDRLDFLKLADGIPQAAISVADITPIGFRTQRVP